MPRSARHQSLHAGRTCAGTDQHELALEDQRPTPERKGGATSGWLPLVRVVVPAALAIAGVILLSVGSPFMGGALVTSAGVAVMVGFFARLTIASNLQRDREEEARRAFRETGRWPGRRR